MAVLKQGHMRQFNRFKGTKGFITPWNRMLRFWYMITEQAKQRCRILAFWEKHGTKATREAFHLSERTLFRWQSALKQTNGKLEGLNKKKTSPKNKRSRNIPEDIQNAIIAFRKEHPRLGKEKVWKLLCDDYGYHGSVSTVGRIISYVQKRGLLPHPVKLSYYARTGNLIERKVHKTKKIRRPRDYAECVEVDTIVRFVDGIKRYVLTAVDTKKKFAFAFAYPNHSSKSATDFLLKLKTVAPFEITAVQTDNGSEFMDYFKQACVDLRITQFHTYPRSPKMNAYVERFNRTQSEEFLVLNRSLMRDDILGFNQKIIEYLLWYNTKRPHCSLSLLSPMGYIVNTLSEADCQMRWTNTGA
ncbi:MAG: DDE-type integrase/transposase/recombinase [Candidatus Lloydbacteria bacterium]|nr:DDE-type integrase/transposase/recombinase [Candidatus Lloydbacteria bacterium]